MSYVPSTINQTKRKMLQHKDNWAIPYFISMQNLSIFSGGSIG